MKTTVKFANFEITFTDSDIVNIDEVDCFDGECNPHNSRLWLLHDHGFTICVVQADCLQDALDEAVDNDKLDRYLVTEVDAKDYRGNIYDCESLSYLGNASEPFDIETLGFVELPKPKQSLCRLFGEEIKATNYHV